MINILHTFANPSHVPSYYRFFEYIINQITHSALSPSYQVQSYQVFESYQVMKLSSFKIYQVFEFSILILILE